MKQITLLFFILSCLTISAQVQVGSDIDGEAPYDRSGYSVSLSSDGTRVAIGAYLNDGNGSNSGHVRIYNYLILPVELISFQGHSNESVIRLNWKTASELNNSGFEIQKSKNGRDWQILDFVDGRGTTSEANEYQYQDKYPFSGINYYRLKQLDFDGALEYSNVIAVEYTNSKRGIQIFPNPSNGLINLQINNPSNQRMKIKVSDNLGRKVWESELLEGESNWREEIEIEGNGIYFISAQIGDKIHYERVVIRNEK